MTVEGRLAATIQAPAKYLPHLAIMSLSENGWPSGLFNLVDEITVQKRKSEKAGGIGYELDFNAILSWKPINDQSSRLIVTVRERSGNANTKECQRECFNLIRGIDDRAKSFVEALEAQPPRTTYGDAHWASDRDLAESGYLCNEADSAKFVLGPHDKAKFLALKPDETERHAIVCGPTGSGKTSSLFVPNLILRRNWSAIVTEATAGSPEGDDEFDYEMPDLMQKTAGYRAQEGHKVYYFNPDDLRSDRINPIQGITSIRQATRLTNLLMQNTSRPGAHTGEQFWENAETALLNSLIMHTAGQKGHLGLTRTLLREGPRGLETMLKGSNVAEARARYKEFLLWSPENTRNSIVLGLMQRLELWTQPRVVALTEKNDIDFDALKDELFTFYLAVPADKPELKPCAAIILTYLINYVSAKRLKTRVSLYLDEFTNFGYIPDFPNKLSIIRHRHIPAMLGLQDYAQAEEIYKNTAATLFSQPATRIYFKPQTLAQAKIISESLGTETKYERTVSSNCQIVEKEFGRDLMTPGAVQQLGREYSIVFMPDKAPLKLKRYAPQDFDYATKIAPPARRVLAVNDALIQACVAETQEPEWINEEPNAGASDGQERKAADEHERPKKEESKESQTRTFNEYGDRIPPF